MKRRNFIVGLGALSAGGAAALSTGAFSSVEAERDVSVEVAEDAAAYLALEATSDYAEENENGVLELEFGDLEDHGDGVGEDSSYFFGSGNPDRNVFTVQNQGTQTVEVTPAYQVLRFDSNGEPVDEGGELVIALGSGSGNETAELSPGDSTGYFVQVVTGDDPPDELTATFEINANEV